MRVLVLVAALLQTLLVVSGGDVPFETCASPAFIPDRVTITPYPVKLFGNLTVEINGVTNLTVTGGSFEYNIALRIKTPIKTWYLTVDDATEDLCHRAQCPIKPGLVTLVYKKRLPPVLAPGLYRVQIEATTFTGVTLLCIVVHLDFVFPSQHEKQPLIT